MKYFFLFLILASCGKHQMPMEKDLADNDGDQIPNAYEESDLNKFVANVTPVGKLKGKMTFKQGKVTPIETIIDLENKKDISTYSKDLMVKTMKLSSIDDFFSQYSLLALDERSPKVPITQELIYANITISDKNMNLNLYLISKDKNEYLGSFRETINISFTHDTLNSILSGESILAVTKNDRKPSFLPTQEATIKEKSYRVFYDDGKETKIYYVSKEMSFENFLSNLGIDDLYPISEVDLLSTNYFYRTSVWWLRDLNPRDKVLVKDDVKNLSLHYLQGFARNTSEIVRTNGSVSGALKIQKDSSSKALIKIRSSLVMNSFHEFHKNSTYRTGSIYHGSDIDNPCKISYRNLIDQKVLEVNEAHLRNEMKVFINKKLSTTYILKPGHDENGAFWEIQLDGLTTDFEIFLENSPPHSFFVVGVTANSCRGSKEHISGSTANSENKFSLFFETFVEKI